MRDVFLFLLSKVEFGEFFIPVAVLIAAVLAGFSVVLKNSWPSICGALMLFMVYFLPTPS